MERFKSLEKEYKCTPFFVSAKLINGRKSEKNFHDLLRIKYPSLIEEFMMDSKKKVELYKLSPVLIHEYDVFLLPIDISESPIIDDDDTRRMIELIKGQEKRFLEMISNREAGNMMKYIELKEKYLHERLLIQERKEIREHEEKMKDKDIRLAELRDKNIDKDIRLAELRDKNIDKELKIIKLQLKLKEH